MGNASATQRFDIAIVGGGVAAAAATLALTGTDCSIAILGPRKTASVRVGESLAPAAEAILRRLGAWQAFLADGHRCLENSFSAWGSSMLASRSSLLHLDGVPWHIDRDQFETTLWNVAEGVAPHAAISELCTSSRCKDDIWRLTGSNGTVLEASFVIDCSGRSSVIGRRASRQERLDTLVAAYSALVQVETEIQVTPGTLVESIEQGWLYSALLPDGRLMVNAFTDADLVDRSWSIRADAWQSFVFKSEYTRRRIESAGFAIEEPARVTDASSRRLARFAGPNWAAAGDAAASFDPLSSHGIVTALWSGERAALAARAALEGDRSTLETYQSDLGAGFDRYQTELRQNYLRETRFANATFWRRRASLAFDPEAIVHPLVGDRGERAMT